MLLSIVTTMALMLMTALAPAVSYAGSRAPEKTAVQDAGDNETSQTGQTAGETEAVMPDEQSGQRVTRGFVDENGDGINDNVPGMINGRGAGRMMDRFVDEDGDGINDGRGFSRERRNQGRGNGQDRDNMPGNSQGQGGGAGGQGAGPGGNPGGGNGNGMGNGNGAQGAGRGQ